MGYRWDCRSSDGTRTNGACFSSLTPSSERPDAIGAGPQSPTESIRAKSGDTPAGDTLGPAGALAEPGGIRSPSRLAHAGTAVQRLTNAPTRFGRGRLQTVSRLRDEARAGSHERERTLGGLESLREASLVETQRVRQRVGPRRLPPQRRRVRIVHRLERRNLELGRRPRVLLGGDDRELRQRAVSRWPTPSEVAVASLFGIVWSNSREVRSWVAVSTLGSFHRVSPLMSSPSMSMKTIDSPSGARCTQIAA